jgi:DNA invertase Pin-like site-specific DNA recombinase
VSSPRYAEGTTALRLKVDAPKRTAGGRLEPLTDETVRSIRRAFALGLTQAEIAKQLGIGRTAVSNVVTGRRYSEVE